MTLEEQRELATRSGLTTGRCPSGAIYYVAFPENLATYTAAVEAKERERCAIEIECDAHNDWEHFAKLIRGLK